MKNKYKPFADPAVSGEKITCEAAWVSAQSVHSRVRRRSSNADDRRSADHIHPQHPAAFAHRQQRRAADEHRDGLLHARVLLCRHIGAEHNWYEAGWEYHRRTHHHLQSERRHHGFHDRPHPSASALYPRRGAAHTLFGIRRMD